MVENKIIKVANDLGYGSLKASINGKDYVIPSVIAQESVQNIPAAVEFDNKQSMDNYMANFLDLMDVSVSSSIVKQQGRYLIGKAAIKSGLQTQTFDINDYSGKSESDLSAILSLSLIAGQRVQTAYANGEDLNETLKANVNYVTSLPVSEVNKANVKDLYRDKFLKNSHTVTFHNFKNPINVTITFNKVYVGVEGEVAQMYIVAGNDKELLAGMKKDYETNYPKLSKELPFEEVNKSKSRVNIDVGAGTTDITVIIDGKAVASLSISVPRGFGSVLEDAIDDLQLNNYSFESRDQLQQYLLEPMTPVRARRRERVKEIVKRSEEPLVDRIVAEFSRAIRRAGADIEVVNVNGGGSIPLMGSQLRAQLMEKLRSFSGGYDDVPVIWVPEKEASTVNLNGLKMIVNIISKED